MFESRRRKQTVDWTLYKTGMMYQDTRECARGVSSARVDTIAGSDDKRSIPEKRRKGMGGDARSAMRVQRS